MEREEGTQSPLSCHDTSNVLVVGGTSNERLFNLKHTRLWTRAHHERPNTRRNRSRKTRSAVATRESVGVQSRDIRSRYGSMNKPSAGVAIGSELVVFDGGGGDHEVRAFADSRSD